MSLAYPVRMVEVTRDPHAAIKHAWFSSISGRNVTDLTAFELFEMGFRRGAQWSARISGQLSPHLAALADFLIWLNDKPAEQDDWDTFVEPAPVEYVASDGAGTENDPW
jgi:hypothetical protein